MLGVVQASVGVVTTAVPGVMHVVGDYTNEGLNNTNEVRVTKQFL